MALLISFTSDMAANVPDPAKSKSATPSGGRNEGFPSNEELLHELRLHGAKPAPPRKLPLVGRRTRDYLLTAGTGSVAIGFSVFSLVGDSGSASAVKLAVTGIAVFCGLLWFIFYGVMSRY